MARNAKQLALEYTDPDWRRRYTEVCSLLDILADCTIAPDYTVPDELNSAIVLTAAGQQLADKLIRKEEVPPKEARLMCALTLGHEDLLIDVERTDIDKLRRSIDSQLKRKEIRFPFTFGRDLYDAYADLFEEEKDDLGHEETVQLLNRIPEGVFQYGHYVVGPLGVLQSARGRNVRSTRRVPAYHCAQPVCHVVHRAYLTTSPLAPVNSHRTKLHNLLDATGTQGSE